MDTTRRSLLTAIGGAGSAALSGCSFLPQPVSYGLLAPPLGSDPASAFAWEPRWEEFAENDRALVDRLRVGETVTIEGYRLVEERSIPGIDEEVPPIEAAIIEGDGTYRQITLEDTTSVERTRWLVWVDLLDERPADGGEVAESIPTTLSEMDRYVLEWTIDRSTLGDTVREYEGVRPNRRGFVFRRYDPAESDLVPAPPFKYYKHTYEGYEPAYFEVIAEQVSIREVAYTYSTREIGMTLDELERHVETSVLATATDLGTLSDAHRQILSDAVHVSTGSYQESGRLSSTFRDLLNRLGFGVPTVERSDQFGPVYFLFDGQYYRARLNAWRGSLPRAPEGRFPAELVELEPA